MKKNKPFTIKPFTILLPVLLLQAAWSLCQPSYTVERCRHDRYHHLEFEHFSSENGMPANSCLSLLQDSKGFIWIGTANGLAKFDGYDFTSYTHNIEDSSSIASNSIWSMMEDRNGLLWFGTERGGINIFDRDTEKFTHFLHDQADVSSLGTGLVAAIIEDSEGVVWIATRGGGLNRYNREAGNFTRFTHDPGNEGSISSDMVVSLLEDSNGDLWAGTWGAGLNLLDKASGNFRHYLPNPDDPGSISGSEIPAIYEDVNGNLWFGTTHKGFDRYDRANDRFINYRHDPLNPNSLIHNTVFRISGDSEGNLLIGTWGGGLDVFDPVSERFTHYSSSEQDESLSDDYIFSILPDRTGALWIGTDDALNRSDLFKKPFMHFVSPQDVPGRLVSQPVVSLYQDREGLIWAGTTDGFYSLDPLTGIVHETYKISNDAMVRDHSVTAIAEDRNGFLWFGTSQGTLIGLRKRDGSLTRYGYSGKALEYAPGKMVSSIYCGRDNVIWLATEGDGLIKFDLNTQTAEQFIPGFNITDLRIMRDLKPLADEQLLIGTRSGLLVFDQVSETFHQAGAEDSLRNASIISLNIFSLLPQGKNRFWIATVNEGLFTFNSNEGSLISIGDDHGLNDNHIFCLTSDGGNNLWAGTKKGVSRIDPVTYSVRNYEHHDGLPVGEIRKAIQLKDGSIVLGGTAGLVQFRPEDLKDNPFLPQLAFTNLMLNNKSLNPLSDRSPLSKPIGECDEVTFKHNQDVITLEYAAMHYGDPGRNLFSYILEGFDKEWTTNTDKRSVTYANLSPGKYVFRLKAANHDGIWNDEGISLRIIVNPPWGRTYLAYAVYLILLLTGLYFLRRYELNRQRVKHELELEKLRSESLVNLDTMKSGFFANISHEFRTPLSLIMGPSESIIECSKDEFTRKQARAIRRNAGRLLSLINQLLDLSKIEAGKLRLQASKGNLVSFTKMMVMSFESLAANKDITLLFHPGSDQVDVWFDHEKMEKILSNLIVNAIKFTPAGGEVTVSIRSREDLEMAEITVKDNGIGIDENSIGKIFDRFYRADISAIKENEGTGIGLALTRELVELHNGMISAESKPGEWTVFTVMMPMGDSHFSEEEILPSSPEQSVDGHSLLPQAEFEDHFLAAPSAESELAEDEEKPIVLIVEDNFDFRAYLKDILGPDYTIREAVNGEQGIQKARNIVPDLIISDIMMPGTDGNAMTETLKKELPTSHVPIILLTARSDQESKLAGLLTGADDFLTKPFDPKELRIKVKNLIEIRRSLQEKYSGLILKSNEGNGKIPGAIDEQFMEKILAVIEDHYDDENFRIERFARELGMSRTQLHRKIKALMGKSASQFIRSVRLIKAKKLIEENGMTISEIAYSVGFSSPAYFTRCFREEFGVPPSDLQK